MPDGPQLNSLDRIIGWFSPMWALRRQQARDALAELLRPAQPSAPRQDRDWRRYDQDAPTSWTGITSGPVGWLHRWQ